MKRNSSQASLTDREAAAYLAGLIDGEGCVSLCTLKTGRHAGDQRRIVTIGMTDREIIDLAARLLAQLGIGFCRSERQPNDPARRYVWTIAVTARADLIRLAAMVPIKHSAKQANLAAILASYKTAKVYARRSDHKSPLRDGLTGA